MGVLWGEHESKASLRSELGRGSKHTLWHRRSSGLRDALRKYGSHFEDSEWLKLPSPFLTGQRL